MLQLPQFLSQENFKPIFGILGPVAFRCTCGQRRFIFRKFSKSSQRKKGQNRGFWHIYMPSVANVLTRSSEKNFLCSNVVLDIQEQVETIFRKKNWGSGSVNTFATELFFENRQFSENFLKFQNALAPSIFELGEF